jgi:hypothetical protein
VKWRWQRDDRMMEEAALYGDRSGRQIRRRGDLPERERKKIPLSVKQPKKKITPSNKPCQREREKPIFLAWPAGDRAGLRRNLPERDAGRQKRSAAEREAGEETTESAGERGNMPEREREREREREFAGAGRAGRRRRATAERSRRRH